MTVTPGESPPLFRHVSLWVLLETQHRQLATALETLLQSLRKEEMEHREQFRGGKLSALFPGALGYYFEKVYESTRGTDGWEFGAVHVALINEILEKFRAALTQRGIAGAYQGVEYQLESLDYPMGQLAEYFQQKGKGRLNERDAVILTSFVEGEMLKLQEMADELDKEYGEPPN